MGIERSIETEEQTRADQKEPHRIVDTNLDDESG